MKQKSSSRKENGGAVKKYLLFYNAVQTIGWAYILYLTILHLLTTGSSHGLWDKIEFSLEFYQTLGVLEVLHAASGIVPSGVMVTAFQLASRVFVVWGIIWSVPQVCNSFAVPVILLAWAPTETIRYSYYFLNILKVVPPFLIWIRYTSFIVLYPLGLLGELSSIFLALPYIASSGLYSFSLPNCCNFSFNYSYFVMLVAAAFVPVFPMLYLHMFSQRKKILTPKKKHE